jgi:hypothetical protein
VLGTNGLDGLPHGDALVTAQVVNGHRVAWRRRHDQHAPDLGEEARAVDSAFDHHRRADARGPEPRNEARGALVVVGDSRVQAFNPCGTPRIRAIFVLSQASLMKISRSGSRAGWVSN